MSRDHSPFYMPYPNSSGDNINSHNITGSHNHNTNTQNQNLNSFNQTTLSYTINIAVFINNTSDDNKEISKEEIAKRIFEALPVLPNPESILLGSGRESTLPPTDGTGREIIIAVMGVTGTGKSYFIREVSDISNVKVGGGLDSCTAEVQSYSFNYAGATITLVDTPGFDNTTKSDTEILTDICAWMSSSYKKGILLSGIICLHRISDARMDLSSIRYMKMFQRLCGRSALQNVLLTTTKWSDVDHALGERREGELRNERFWGGLIRKGAAVARFMGTKASGLGLIDKLMGNKPKLLDIQYQMVKEGMAIAQTNAGKFTNAEFASLAKKYQKYLEDLKRECQEAVN